MSDSLRPHGRQPTRLLRPRDSPGKNTGVGCHFLLQGKSTLEGINSRISETEEPIWKMVVEITATEQNKQKRMKRNESSLRDFLDSIKCINTHIIGIPEEEKEKGPEEIFEEMIVKNFSHMETVS